MENNVALFLGKEYTRGYLDEEGFRTAGDPTVLSRDAFAAYVDEEGLRTVGAPSVLSRDAFGPGGPQSIP